MEIPYSRKEARLNFVQGWRTRMAAPDRGPDRAIYPANNWVQPRPDVPLPVSPIAGEMAETRLVIEPDFYPRPIQPIPRLHRVDYSIQRG